MESLSQVRCARKARQAYTTSMTPYRVLKPLKRAGPRGSGKWKTISWEELIKCIVDGCTIEETGEKYPG